MAGGLEGGSRGDWHGSQLVKGGGWKREWTTTEVTAEPRKAVAKRGVRAEA